MPDWRTASPSPNPSSPAESRQARKQAANTPWKFPGPCTFREISVKSCSGPCRTSGIRARLRLFERTNSAMELVTILGGRGRFDQISSVTAGNTKRPARTNCLTSAAYCLCSHPSSVPMLSPIPKPASAACSPATCQPSTEPCPIPLTLRHLTTPRILPPEGLALPRPANAYVPAYKFQRAPENLIPFPRKME